MDPATRQFDTRRRELRREIADVKARLDLLRLRIPVSARPRRSLTLRRASS